MEEECRESSGGPNVLQRVSENHRDPEALEVPPTNHVALVRTFIYFGDWRWLTYRQLLLHLWGPSLRQMVVRDTLREDPELTGVPSAGAERTQSGPPMSVFAGPPKPGHGAEHAGNCSSGLAMALSWRLQVALEAAARELWPYPSSRPR